MLSDVVAVRLVQLRKAAGLSREEFAERCRQVGGWEFADFTTAALANVETGRRDSDGRRRRKVNVEELGVFARVLGVPFVWLTADPEAGAAAWGALAWMIGARPLDERSVGEAWSNAAPWLDQLFDLYRQVKTYDRHRELWEDPQTRDDMGARFTEEESRQNDLQAVLSRIEVFRRGGMPLPPLPDHIHDGISEMLLDRARSEIEKLQELQEHRAVGAEWIPDGGDQARRDQAADITDAKSLRRLAEALRRIDNWGLPLPPLPETMTDRARDLEVNLTPFLDSSQQDQ